MNTRKRNKTVLTLAAVAMAIVVLATAPARAALVYEPFAYPDGWLTGQGGALGTIGTWTANDDINGDWRIHQEGDSADIVIAGNTTEPYVATERNVFDGTVANLKTTGGYVGLPGPADTGADPEWDHQIGRYLDGSIALDPSVTATFQSGTTTWISYLAVRAWDRNVETPNLTIGTDPSPNNSRGASLTNSGSGLGTGGGPPRNNRGHIYPMYFDGGNAYTLLGQVASWTDDAKTAPADGRMDWVARDDDGFGAANIVVVKIQWDADAGGEDIISVARFLEDETLSEAAFDALIAAQPNLSSANWAANKPNLDQSQFDLINIAGIKFFVDEIRLGTSFLDAMGIDPNAPDVDAGSNWITWSGESVAIDATITEVPGSDWTDLTYTWTANPDGSGPDLDVAITGADTVDATVEITKTAPTGDATIVTLTLSVGSAGKEPVTSAVTIDVYDDSCKAAEGTGTLVLDPGDFDGNCITNLKDQAVMAAKWLDDYTSTGPVPKL